MQELIDTKLEELIETYMKGMNKNHIPGAKTTIIDLIINPNYDAYVNVFDKENYINSRSIIDIEETILTALKKGN